VWFDGNVGFAVGRKGTVVRYENGAWRALNSGTTSWLRGVWGRRADDVYAVGRSGTVIHWDGKSWSHVDVNVRGADWLMGVHGDDDDVVIVGGSGAVLRFDGKQWSAEDSGVAATLRSVWVDDNGLLICGDDGAILYRSRR